MSTRYVLIGNSCIKGAFQLFDGGQLIFEVFTRKPPIGGFYSLFYADGHKLTHNTPGSFGNTKTRKEANQRLYDYIKERAKEFGDFKDQTGLAASVAD